MSLTLAAMDQSVAFFGLLVAAAAVIGLIVNVSTFGTRDLNRNAGIATNLLLIALLLESAAWTVRSFGGGTPDGVFAFMMLCVILHVVSASMALRAMFQFRTIGRWPYGRRRALWGFWLNVIALIALAAWFYLMTNERAYNRLIN